MTDQLKKWMGEFGDDYTDRCMPDDKMINDRTMFWSGILAMISPLGNDPPKRILEVGSNVGANLLAIDKVYSAFDMPVSLYYNEPNKKAREILDQQPIRSKNEVMGNLQSLECNDGHVDTVITCGVLIHVHPDNLYAAMREVYRVSSKYIVCAEYFSPEPREILYRGSSNMLWSRDFGSEWIDKFPGMRCVGYSFAWKRMTGMDNLVVWVFQKVN